MDYVKPQGVVESMLAGGVYKLNVPPRHLLLRGMLAGAYLGLAFWSRKMPFPAAIVGLVIFLTLIAAGAVLDPSDLYKGILVKVLVIVGLARAIQAGARCRALERELAAQTA